MGLPIFRGGGNMNHMSKPFTCNQHSATFCRFIPHHSTRIRFGRIRALVWRVYLLRLKTKKNSECFNLSTFLIHTISAYYIPECVSIFFPLILSPAPDRLKSFPFILVLYVTISYDITFSCLLLNHIFGRKGF